MLTKSIKRNVQKSSKSNYTPSVSTRRALTALLETIITETHLDNVDEQRAADLYSLHEWIGQGTFGVVWSGRDKATGRTCAVKIIEINDDLAEIKQQIMILKECQTPYVVKNRGLLLFL